MSNDDTKDRADQGAGARAGGNVQTKGASKGPAESDASARAGGNVQTKGASGGSGQQPQPPEQARDTSDKNSS